MLKQYLKMKKMVETKSIYNERIDGFFNCGWEKEQRTRWKWFWIQWINHLSWKAHTHTSKTHTHCLFSFCLSLSHIHTDNTLSLFFSFYHTHTLIHTHTDSISLSHTHRHCRVLHIPYLSATCQTNSHPKNKQKKPFRTHPYEKYSN